MSQLPNIGTERHNKTCFCNKNAGVRGFSFKLLSLFSHQKRLFFLNLSMRLVIQRVSRASVTVEDQITGAIDQGLLVLLGIEQADSEEDIDWLVQKLIQMRIFSDRDGKMNCSLVDIDGGLLVVSQFTLHASTKKGNRPSFIAAARPEQAIPLYELFLQKAALQLGKKVQAGIFGADMKVELINDGPVTITIDSKNRE